MRGRGFLCRQGVGALCRGVYFLRLITTLLLLAAAAMAQQEQPLTRAMKFISELRDTVATKPGFTSIKEVNRVFVTPGSAERVVKFSGVVFSRCRGRTIFSCRRAGSRASK